MQQIAKKIVLIGHFGVGKTSLIRRFVHSKFSEEYISTIGVKVDKKVIQVGDTEMSMLIWDVAGESTVGKIPQAYLAGSHGFLYVFDLTRPTTYENLKTETAQLLARFPHAGMKIIANKADLLSEDAKIAFNDHMEGGFDYYVSALTGENVENAFQALGEAMHR